jgi:hypothetical protein
MDCITITLPGQHWVLEPFRYASKLGGQYLDGSTR